MAKKPINERCPLQSECGRKKCEFQFHESKCNYYIGNSRPGYEIPDQENEPSSIWDDAAETTEVTGGLTYISIDELYPHPDNPRKDLGDLTELSDSIKAKGVLQNLTVVKGHAPTQEEWSKYNKLYNENPSEELREKINAKWYEDGYTVIIGHRRTEASRMAGLTTLPCIIADMTPEEQVTTMMLENMQRSDLTVYEQAKGFQLMLDFGNTVETVAEKSGFSPTTVRRRIKLLELDEEKFKKSESRNVSLFEYMELDKIKDIERKNRVLDFAGTANFNNELQKAITEEELQEYLDEVESNLSKFATETKDSVGCSWVTDYGNWNKKEVVVPDDTDTVQYFYKKNDRYITLYKKKEEIPVDEEAERIKAEKDADRERRKDGLKECSVRAFELRKEAINCMSNSHAQKHLTDIIIFIMKMTKEFYVSIEDDYVLEMIGVDTDSEEYEDWDDEKLDTYIHGLIETTTKEKPALMLLKLAYAISEDTDQSRYYEYWNAKHASNKRLDMIYDFLCSLGYELSDEEKALRDGTHELFITEES